MIIPYATANELLPQYLTKHLEPAGYRLIPYHDKPGLDNFSVIILFSPMFLNDYYVSPDAVWQRYFKVHKPGLRLISAGYAGPVHSNYLDLSAVPADFGGFLSRAVPVSADTPPLNTGGLDMATKLGKFFEGHGGESIMSVFTTLKRAIVVINYLQTKPGGEKEIINAYFGTDADFLQRWRRFSLRWNFYFPFWSCLPVISLFNNIDNHIKILDQVFNTNAFNLASYTESAASERFQEIQDLLEEIEIYAR